MQTITIAEKLWLEPTILGATLNFVDGPDGWNYHVGISFQSFAECQKSLAIKGTVWTMRDKSLMILDNGLLHLTFCPGTTLERHLILKGAEMQAFKRAVSVITLTSQSLLN